VSNHTNSPSQPTQPRYQQAIVIGGSIAGLITAQVLSQHFAQVTLIERDHFSEQAEHRKGVPQARHAHQLLLRGLQAVEQIFPGLTEELKAAGAVPVNLGQELRWYVFGQTRVQYESSLSVISLSRPLLESTIYRRVAAQPNIRMLPRTEVLGIETDAGGAAVAGLRVRPIAGDHQLAEERTLQADLVVDASGRESRSSQWLSALGFPTPEESVISSRPGYASRVYRRPVDFPEEVKAIYVQQTPPDLPRGAIILPMENDLWQVSALGMRGDHPPTDEQGFLEFLRSLPSPLIYDAVRQAEPVSPIFGFRNGETRERRFHTLPRYLEGFVALGDAVYAFNPVYGQGMTVAALSAQLLGSCLAEQSESGLAGLAQRFQTGLADVCAGPWQLASGEDRRWASDEDQAQIDPVTQLSQRYVEQVIKASLTNPALAEVFFAVMQMVELPTVFFRPDVVLQVFATLPTGD
jgi:2-polyprenyl-6-methoxyphenol hydroxylase-like FAD-dependent oxidoreductase